MRIDLHVHTTISDSSLSTKEMLLLAKERGLTHVAITNHDTVVGLKEAMEFGKAIGVEVIPGIEISAYDFKRQKKTHHPRPMKSLDLTTSFEREYKKPKPEENIKAGLYGKIEL